MSSSHLFPDDKQRPRDTDLFTYDKPVSKPRTIIEKIFLFIFSTLGTLCAFIAISYYSYPEDNNKDSFVGPNFERSLGNLFMFPTVLFFLIAGCAYLSMRQKQKKAQ